MSGWYLLSVKTVEERISLVLKASALHALRGQEVVAVNSWFPSSSVDNVDYHSFLEPAAERNWDRITASEGRYTELVQWITTQDLLRCAWERGTRGYGYMGLLRCICLPGKRRSVGRALPRESLRKTSIE